MENAINWFNARRGKTFYSMVQRNGQVVNGKLGYDCSSSVYYALNEAGLLPGLRIGNTDSLFGDLERNGWVKVGPNAQGNFDTRRGDVFIWGKRGASGGASGHTGMFLNADDIIHCAAFSNGITVNNYDQLRGWNAYPEQTFYRYVGTGSRPQPTNPVDQVLEVGSTIIFEPVYTVNDVQNIGGIWQVKTDKLCQVDFTWDDNGIPAEPLVEVDDDGYKTSDQELYVGSKYIIPGKYQVQDLGEYKGHWLALIEWNGLKFWVDIESVTEVASDHPGRGIPGERPAPQPEPTPGTTPEPETPPTEEPVKEEPVKEEPKPEEPKEEEPQKEEPKPQEPKEDKVAFTKEDQQQLLVASEDLKSIAAGVAEQNGDITSSISPKVKVAVYFTGDALIAFGGLIPMAAIAFAWGLPVDRITAMAGLSAGAGLALLTAFGIYKSGKK